jgi:7-cyano-7-deazaguanine synthase
MRESEVDLCLTFDYGQRAASKEMKAAEALASHYQVEHMVIDLPFLRDITQTALVRDDLELPQPDRAGLDDFATSSAAAAAVWVPNRNGVFINVAAAFAESRHCGLVVTGFNLEEAATFPDNSQEFVIAASHALGFSTMNKAKVVSYTQRLDKVEIIKLGLKLGVPFKHIWSCYRGYDKMCGSCESCQRFKRAAVQAGLDTTSFFI